MPSPACHATPVTNPQQTVWLRPHRARTSSTLCQLDYRHVGRSGCGGRHNRSYCAGAHSLRHRLHTAAGDRTTADRMAAATRRSHLEHLMSVGLSMHMSHVDGLDRALHMSGCRRSRSRLSHVGCRRSRSPFWPRALVTIVWDVGAAASAIPQERGWCVVTIVPLVLIQLLHADEG